MDPVRKRRLRLIVALTAVVLLASALVYTSGGASVPVRYSGTIPIPSAPTGR